MASSDKDEHFFKVLGVGDVCGKTALIQRYVHGRYKPQQKATVGVAFALKVIDWDADTFVRLQLWDISGQERFTNMTRVYYKDAVGVVVMFDVTRRLTFEGATKRKNDLYSKVRLPNGQTIPAVLLANKCDLPKEKDSPSPEELDQYCKDNGYIGWFETSAKENINIEEAFSCLVTKIMQNQKDGKNPGRKTADDSATTDSFRQLPRRRGNYGKEKNRIV